jgi:glucokinase
MTQRDRMSHTIPTMPDNRRCLVGDIGGSNARFAIARRAADGVALDHVVAMRGTDHVDLVAAIEYYLRTTGEQRPPAAAIAIAGPIVGDHAEITNHMAWSFPIEATRRRLSLERLTALNDFTAIALSLPHLRAGDQRQIGGGAATAGAPIGVIGPGTGLGVSGVLHTATGWAVIQGEGGHATFGPMSERESRIADLLRARFGHVSWERVLSGPGLVNLYTAIAQLDGQAAEPLTPEAIDERGRNGSCAMCREALETFCAVLGTAAGSVALTLGARGGVFIGGGIVPRLESFFDTSAFRSRFESKGRLSDYVRPIPTFVITAAYPGLIGAAMAVL